jgi:hypothetical protein
MGDCRSAARGRDPLPRGGGPHLFERARDLAECYRLGANSYLRKPADFLQFADAVRQLGLYGLVLNEPPPTVRP